MTPVVPVNDHDLAACARRFYETFAGDDRAAMEAVLDPAFRFSTPADPDLDRDGFLERCWPHRHLISGMRLDTVVPYGDDGVLVRYAATGVDGPFHNMERLRIVGGRLIEAEVFWGPVSGAFGRR